MIGIIKIAALWYQITGEEENIMFSFNLNYLIKQLFFLFSWVLTLFASAITLFI